MKHAQQFCLEQRNKKEKRTLNRREEKTTKNRVQNKSGSNQHAAGVCR